MIRDKVPTKPAVDRARGTISLPKLSRVIFAKVSTIMPPKRNMITTSRTNINFLGTMRVVYKGEKTTVNHKLITNQKLAILLLGKSRGVEWDIWNSELNAYLRKIIQ